MPFFNLGFMSNSLVFMLCYVWSKNFATQPTSLYGLITVQVAHTSSLLCAHARRATCCHLSSLLCCSDVVCVAPDCIVNHPVCRLLCFQTSTVVAAV